ncbi:MAG: diguanylate cyclase [Synechococcales cyanobacterium RU_4_20]|nr:diguanylate cyclase [Synechococcales cyanobacterium RU_4_20]
MPQSNHPTNRNHPINQKHSLDFQDEPLFLDEQEESAVLQKTEERWKVLVVDDEKQVHEVTRLALKNFQFEDKPLEIISAYSGQEAQAILDRNPDTAVLLLDVVMETNYAGLELVKHIRENLHNPFVRIILRTGQPGEAPEISVIKGYDINDYKTKTELTQQKLLSVLVTAIRSYRDIVTVEDARQEISALNEKLQDFNHTLEESVRMRTQELEEKNRQLEIEIQARMKAQEELQKLNRALDRANKELDRANRQLLAVANQDGLTKLANRRRFDEYLEQTWRQALRDRHTLTLILCDIDYFKQFNDTYGHVEGDRCLQTVAETIERAIERPMDLAARYGGEEFALILPNTNLQGGQVVAEKLQIALEQLSIGHASSLVSDRITLSIGVSALLPTSELTTETLLAATDTALYEAKKSGRARVVAYHPKNQP